MPGNGHCMYSMTGNFAGLDAEEKKRIFYDIDTTPGQSGSGILLPVVGKYLKEHGPWEKYPSSTKAEKMHMKKRKNLR